MLIVVLLLVASCCKNVIAFRITTTTIAITSPSYKKLVCFGSASYGNEDCKQTSNRRKLLLSTLYAPFVATSVPYASAANLPQSTGADLSRTGSIDTLIPIIAMKQSLESINSQLMTERGKLESNECKSILQTLQKNIPRAENDFKRIFDSYSTPVSYKQKFLDQNAFLVCE